MTPRTNATTQAKGHAARPRAGSEIVLQARWKLGKKMEQGGFGEIFQATSSEGQPAVVKLIPKDPGAQRELLFDLPSAPNVLPSIDRGEWGEYWVLVMPRAKESLRQHLSVARDSLRESEVLPILHDIASGLAAMAGKIVHRDLKPENVLFWDGHWRIADFGIARYAAATTAPDTRKDAMTWAYAAPEQWRLERATEATDIYASGVLAFELLEGRPPFQGPTANEFRQQHLYDKLPEFKRGSAPLQALVSECLLKEAQARPTAASVVGRLQHLDSPASAGLARLQQAYGRQVSLDLAEQTKRAQESDEAARRRRLYSSAEGAFKTLVTRMADTLRTIAPTARVETRDGFATQLGLARLVVEPLRSSDAGRQARSQPGFEVIAHSKVSLSYLQPQRSWGGRSHSLWYANALDRTAYRLVELAFMQGWTNEIRSIEPFALDPGEDAYLALSPVMHTCQSAWKFTPVDQGEEGAFIDRWLGWLADAAEGALQRPHTLPEHQP